MPKALDLGKIVQFPFPESQYYKEETKKKQIVLHHTVSNAKAENVWIYWANNPEHVATPLVISGDGKMVQGFSTKYWAHHLGLKTAGNNALNRQAIGIEICSWGGLTFDGQRYRNVYGNIVNENAVISYPKSFRGFKHFQRYTDAQIESVRQLLVYLCDKYGIPKTYNLDMWDMSDNALGGKSGIYTHVSYRKDKSDCHPQPELIAMLKSL